MLAFLNIKLLSKIENLRVLKEIDHSWQQLTFYFVKLRSLSLYNLRCHNPFLQCGNLGTNQSYSLQSSVTIKVLVSLLRPSFKVGELRAAFEIIFSLATSVFKLKCKLKASFSTINYHAQMIKCNCCQASRIPRPCNLLPNMSQHSLRGPNLVSSAKGRNFGEAQRET